MSKVHDYSEGSYASFRVVVYAKTRPPFNMPGKWFCIDDPRVKEEGVRLDAGTVIDAHFEWDWSDDPAVFNPEEIYAGMRLMQWAKTNNNAESDLIMCKIFNTVN